MAQEKRRGASGNDPLEIFRKRILPIMQAKNPSSCTQCHLSGVELADYILPDQAKTFAALRERALIDVDNPEKSKILNFISRKPDKPSLVTERVRQQEYAAFRAWLLAAVKDPKLLDASSDEALGPQLPREVIRHARKDRVLASFIDNVWSEVGRCAACHSPDRNQKQVREHGERVSWIKLRDPQATLNHMIRATLIDVEFPEDSLLLTKPTLQVEHGGGKKMVLGDRTYKQFRRFIDDYAAVVGGEYQTAEQLPTPNDEVSYASDIWLKIAGVPARYDKLLLAVDLFRNADGQAGAAGGWTPTRWAAADRQVFGKGRLWQQQLSLTAPRESKRAREIRRARRLPPGKYLIKIYIDQQGKLQKQYPAELGDEEYVGQIVLESRWPKGYNRMTVVRYPGD